RWFAVLLPLVVDKHELLGQSLFDGLAAVREPLRILEVTLHVLTNELGERVEVIDQLDVLDLVSIKLANTRQYIPFAPRSRSHCLQKQRDVLWVLGEHRGKVCLHRLASL